MSKMWERALVYGYCQRIKKDKEGIKREDKGHLAILPPRNAGFSGFLMGVSWILVATNK